jgi:uncharacterized membrane protein
VVAAIRAAQARTAGEIRVAVARHRARQPMAAAQRHFARLGMDHTPDRNAVLIFLAPRSKNFAIIGDRGVHEKCGDAFWTEVAAAMSVHFKTGDFTAGVVHGIERAGALLAEHFPRSAGGPGSAPDAVEDVD